MKKSLIINTDNFQKYIKDIKKIPVLSLTEQTELFLELKNEKLTKSRKEKIYNRIIEGNLKFVISVAKNYQNQGLELMDIINEGNIGLHKAIDKFEIESNNRFISYAVWWIKQSIIESLYKNGRTINIPSNVLQEHHRSKNGIKNFNFESICDDHDKILDLDFSDNVPYCVPLESEINEEGNTLIEVIVNENADNPEDIFDTPEEVKKRLKSMLNILDKRERKVLIDYYGLDGSEISLEDIGEQIGCTKERVRQIKVTAIKKLKNESYHLIKYV